MQRQESAVFDVTEHTDMACPLVEPIVNFPANKTFGPASPGLTSVPNDMTFTQDGATGKIPIHPSPKFKNDNPSFSKINPESSFPSQETPHDMKVTQDNPAVPLKSILLLPPKRSQSMKIPGKQAGRHHVTESLRNQKQWLDLSTSEATREAKLGSKFMGSVSSAPKYPKVCGKKDMQPMSIGCEKKAKSDITFRQDVLVSKRFTKDLCSEAPVKVRDPKGFNLTAATLNASLGNVSPQSSESEKGHRRTDSSSGQSGHERYETPRASFKRPELPPKPTFSHVILPALESSKAMGGWSPKPRQFTFLPELMNSVGAESSSGSEQEAALSSKRVVQGRRNLRKTKSRGKGKGSEGSITSPMVLAADFASSKQSGGSDFGIIIHPVPTGINPDDHTMPEEYLS
ncbi:unnamed protein product [Candidula unifasciata]|uniref:Uncharacterized protein n=1 Tax=Candidula unifasciata TaxID=100452 RepID=A0A8S4A0R5_9EUPU|nr:unnamed protein product [Candidula unifasciata]